MTPMISAWPWEDISPPKRSGNTPPAPGRQPAMSAGTRPTAWTPSPGSVSIRAARRNPSPRSRPITGVFTTCSETSGNGCRTGTPPIIMPAAPPPIRRDRILEPQRFSVAEVSETPQHAFRIGFPSARLSAATEPASDAPASTPLQRRPRLRRQQRLSRQRQRLSRQRQRLSRQRQQSSRRPQRLSRRPPLSS